MDYSINKTELEKFGFSVIAAIYSREEVAAISFCMDNIESDSSAFLKSKNLFAIRQLLQNVPQLQPLIFTPNLLQLLEEVGGREYFLSKALYFDKPQGSNWFVAYHQDLSISVEDKMPVPNYQNWTYKHGKHGVQPPAEILENTITIRIHLDDTDEENGALKVISQSHKQGVCRLDSANLNHQNEVFCRVKKGGVMLMKPLLFHASNRTVSNRQRRVIHLEFCNQSLVTPLKWEEKMLVF